MNTQQVCPQCGDGTNQPCDHSDCNFIQKSAVSTPAAHWRDEGKPDPHDDRYNCERAMLTKGELTDDELANEFYMYDHRGGLHSMMWLGAAKDRIRWLSRALEKSISERDEFKAKAIEFSEKGKAVLKERENSKELNKDFSKIIHDHVVLMQSAWIEWQHGKGAEKAMVWIENSLIGPGQLPDEDEPYSTEPQAWYDANKADPFPKCFCGRPSNILWMGKGFCCEQHYKEDKKNNAQDAINPNIGHPI